MLRRVLGAPSLLRAAPALFITNVPIIMLCVISYFIEGVTICWEITCLRAARIRRLLDARRGAVVSARPVNT